MGLDDLVLTTELPVSELIGNVVRHAKGLVGLRLLRSRFLTCEASDGSLTPSGSAARVIPTKADAAGNSSPRCPGAGGVRYLHDGKCIWAKQDLPPTQATGEGGWRGIAAMGSAAAA
ncbi:hypothetical protein ACFYMI_34355 [Streptomyces collinus]|uniref:hypothetical protein n=1 Tax=Streptomyces collinus TaxID=42684 RepID=UPI00369F7F18